MEKHILTYSSGSTDKTAVAVTKIKTSGTDVIKEVIYAGVDEGVVILEDLLQHTDYNVAIRELEELHNAAECRRKRTIRKVEQALGITLYEWQKDFIFYEKPYD